MLVVSGQPAQLGFRLALFYVLEHFFHHIFAEADCKHPAIVPVGLPQDVLSKTHFYFHLCLLQNQIELLQACTQLNAYLSACSRIKNHQEVPCFLLPYQHSQQPVVSRGELGINWNQQVFGGLVENAKWLKGLKNIIFLISHDQSGHKSIQNSQVATVFISQQLSLCLKCLSKIGSMLFKQKLDEDIYSLCSKPPIRQQGLIIFLIQCHRLIVLSTYGDGDGGALLKDLCYYLLFFIRCIHYNYKRKGQSNIGFIILLMAEGRTTFLTVNVLRKDSFVPEQLQETPSLSSAKRRKSKIMSSRRTNEQLIMQSHEELLRYVDTVDSRVQGILQAHEGEFLDAYRQHVKKVRDEMEALRNQSSHKVNNEQVHLERIEALEKELAIFRDESLSLFQRLLAKQKEVAELTGRLKEAQAESEDSRKKLQNVMRRNKDLEVALLKLQAKEDNMRPSTVRQEADLSQDKRSGMISPISKQLFIDSNERRPFTSAISYGNSFTLRVQSNQKINRPVKLQQLRQKLQQHSNSKLVNVDTVIQLLSEPQEPEKRSLASYRLAREKLYCKAVSRRKSSYRDDKRDGLIQGQSEELAERREYLSIFKRCVAELKKDIMRRNNIPSLNFFKQNGPKDFIEFKKVEHYLLLQLFLKDEQVLRKFHELLFRGD